MVVWIEELHRRPGDGVSIGWQFGRVSARLWAGADATLYHAVLTLLLLTWNPDLAPWAPQASAYKAVVLEALGQVADDLRGLDNDAAHLSVSQHALDISMESLKLQRVSYTEGKTTVLQLIDAERTYAQAKLGLATARIQQYQDTADLLVALGGGWWEDGVARE